MAGKDQGDERKRTIDEVSKQTEMASKLGGYRDSRISPGGTCLLPGWRPA